jgi:hypothetical protein
MPPSLSLEGLKYKSLNLTLQKVEEQHVPAIATARVVTLSPGRRIYVQVEKPQGSPRSFVELVLRSLTCLSECVLFVRSIGFNRHCLTKFAQIFTITARAYGNHCFSCELRLELFPHFVIPAGCWQVSFSKCGTSELIP